MRPSTCAEDLPSARCVRFFNFLHEYPLYRSLPPNRVPIEDPFSSLGNVADRFVPAHSHFRPLHLHPFNHFHTRTRVHASVRRLAISLGGNAPSLTTLLLDLHASGNGITSGQTPFAASSFSFEKKKKKRKKSSLFFAVNAYIYIYIYLYPGASGNGIANVVFLVRNF